MNMSEQRTRVEFSAPTSLVEEADTVAKLFDMSRTDLLTNALRRQLDDVTTDETFRRRLKEAYYTGRIDFGTLETVLKSEDAARVKLLGESLSREPPVPECDEHDPSPAKEFYDDEPPEWTP